MFPSFCTQRTLATDDKRVEANMAFGVGLISYSTKFPSVWSVV
jgi:hypothetical protein